MKQLMLIIVVASLAGCFGKEPTKSGKEGKPMPEFSMLLTDSITWVHSSNVPKGKSSVLLYLSPYCPYCKSQTKDIIEDMNKLKDINFYFISNFPLPSLREYNKTFELEKYPNITIGRDTTDKLLKYFEITGFPYTAIYDKDKILKKSYEGKIYISQIIKAVEE